MDESKKKKKVKKKNDFTLVSWFVSYFTANRSFKNWFYKETRETKIAEYEIYFKLELKKFLIPFFNVNKFNNFQRQNIINLKISQQILNFSKIRNRNRNIFEKRGMSLHTTWYKHVLNNPTATGGFA